MMIESFSQFYNKYYSRFVHFARSYVNNSSAAEDIAAEAMAACWQNRENLPNEQAALSYVGVVVKNKSLNYIRHVQSRQQAVGSIDDRWRAVIDIESLEKLLPDELLTGEISKIVNDTLNSMSEKTRQVFVMSRLKGIPQKEIADQMMLSLKTVEYHIARAVKTLRLALSDYLVR